MATRAASDQGDIAPSHTLWHYTSANVLELLTRSDGALRLTDFRTRNDAGEANWLSMWVRDPQSDIPEPLRNRLLAAAAAQNYLIAHTHLYSASFSLADDDVGQWMSYGTRGGGVSIGFNAGILATMMAYAENYGAPVTLMRVYYGASAVETAFGCREQFVSDCQRIDQLLRSWEPQCRTYDRVHEAGDDHDGARMLLQIRELWHLLSMSLKSCQYTSEREVRIVAYPNYEGLSDTPWLAERPRPFWTTTTYGLIPYLALAPTREGGISNAISAVRLGPSYLGPEELVKEMLRQRLGRNIAVLRSESRLR